MELNGREVLFKTVHGSKLYGLSHAGSDDDFYTVVAKKPYSGKGQGKARYAKQTIVGHEDSMVVDFGTWVEMCKSGVPQALEAMFSDMAIGEDKIADFRNQFRAGTACHDRYLRTIKSFALSEENSFKKKRHALRLGLNLRSMARYGRFGPTLSIGEVEWVNYWAEEDAETVYRVAKSMATDVDTRSNDVL